MHHANFSLDVKSLSDAGQIRGLAAGYGNLDAHGEIFAPGAFAAALASAKSGGRQPAMLLHHDPRRPVGRWDVLAETKSGLEVEGQLALEASDGREAYALLKAGALSGLSVGFRTIRSKQAPSGATLITEAELFEVSLVATPSNPKTRISDVKAVSGVRDLEELLIVHGGMSSRKAKAMATAAWRRAHDTNDNDEQHEKLAAILRKSIANIRS